IQGDEQEQQDQQKLRGMVDTRILLREDAPARSPEATIWIEKAKDWMQLRENWSVHTIPYGNQGQMDIRGVSFLYDVESLSQMLLNMGRTDGAHTLKKWVIEKWPRNFGEPVTSIRANPKIAFELYVTNGTLALKAVAEIDQWQASEARI